MIKLGKKIVKLRVPILILSFLLLIPSAIGYFNTRINYDILSYLPKDIDTMKGQDILKDEFGTGAFSVCVIDNMEDKDISKLEKKINDIKAVKDVIWYGSVADTSMPIDILPDEVKKAISNADKNSQLMMITFSTAMSEDETMEAIEKI